MHRLIDVNAALASGKRQKLADVSRQIRYYANKKRRGLKRLNSTIVLFALAI